MRIGEAYVIKYEDCDEFMAEFLEDYDRDESIVSKGFIRVKFIPKNSDDKPLVILGGIKMLLERGNELILHRSKIKCIKSMKDLRSKLAFADGDWECAGDVNLDPD